MGEQDPQDLGTDLLTQVAAAVVDRLVGVQNLANYGKQFEVTLTELFKTLIYVLVRIATPAAVASIQAITDASEATRDQRAQVLAASVRNIFGVDVDASQFNDGFGGASRSGISSALVRSMLDALTGGSKSIEPSEEPAQRYVQLVLNQALEGWITGASVELLSAVIPGIEQIQTLGDASNRVAASLGIGDSSSRVLRPYIDNLVVEPLRRKIDSTYRPTLLSPAEVARQFWRGTLTREEAFQELAIQGWSDRKGEMLIAAARRTLTVADVRMLFDRRELSVPEATAHLLEQGYDAERAGLVLQLELVRRQEKHEGELANVAIGAYVAGDLGRGEFVGFMTDAVTNPQERGFLLELAEARRALRAKSLSPAEARACVKAGILSILDYRRALREDGYKEEAVLSLELLLRAELGDERELEAKRAAAAAARDAEQLARTAERAARQAALEAQRAQARRGGESDLERAAIRGLVPLARVDELYRASFDAETAGIYLALLEDDRQRYLDDQARRDEAVQRASRRSIDVGDLEQAVLTNILALDQFRSGLAARGFDAGDTEILTRTLEARKRDLDQARATRSQAGTAAAARAIDLGRFESLVRRGARTLAQYGALLEQLGFDVAARAAMRELLELQIADDTAARQARAAAETALRPKGLSLEQFRRAVVLGLQTPADYERFLLEQRFTAAVVALLMAELADAVAEADAARRQRDTPQRPEDGRDLPLAVVARAARLGTISPAAYQARLVRAGFDDADVALQMDLLIAEIADVQAVRRDRDAPAPAAAPKGIGLPELARAVRRGLQSLEDFQARAIALGFTQDAVKTQLRVLGDELLERQAAALRKQQIVAGLDPGPITLATLEDQVRAGAASILDFIAAVMELGVAPEDAELLGALLLDEQGEG